MAANFTQPRRAAPIGRPVLRATQPATSDAAVHSGYARALAAADRACCCTARPAVTAIMPPGPSRPHRTELLLCMHHYRAAKQALAAVGATVVDAAGHVLAAVDNWVISN